MTFSGNFMPKRFGAGKAQKPKVKTHRIKQPTRDFTITHAKKGKR